LRRRDAGIALHWIGRAYSSLGRYEEALRYLQQALTIHREVKNRQEEATALDTLVRPTST
jgi:tetratricopeptide (TPR) repeat protein